MRSSFGAFGPGAVIGGGAGLAFKEILVAGVVMMAHACEAGMPGFGTIVFALSTMVGYAYDAQKGARYIIGKRYGNWYVYAHLVLLPCGTVRYPTPTVNIVDFSFIVVPNLIACITLAPQVLPATADYFQRYG